MHDKLKILSVNISEKKGTIKHPVESIRLVPGGVAGDAHAGVGNREVSLLGIESIEKFEKENHRKIRHGEFAENMTTSGILLYEVHPMDRFIKGDLVLEVTQIGKECHGTSCAIFREVGNCVMPKEGIFCRVVSPGEAKAGDTLDYHPKVFSVHVITLSDRASRGEYEDKSGPRIIERVNGFFKSRELPVEVSYSLIPDDPDRLKELLEKDIREGVDLTFTSGGTGIGPRDFTPDVVRTMLEKEIPGIMEMIRVKYGSEKPNALSSRSVAGVAGNTLIFTLPGSMKAVNEYFSEIERSLMHLVFMLHGIDHHG
jgi:molybdopterin adenylyltransferase